MNKRKRLSLTYFFLFMIILYSTSITSHAYEKNYKATKYKSFAEIKKSYSTDAKKYNIGATFHNSSLYAYGKLKTKYGKKKVLFLTSGSGNASVITIDAYFKKGKKYYSLCSFASGANFMISKDCKYVVDSISGAEATLYRYKNGEYHVLKAYCGNDKTGQLKKWKKKYKMHTLKFKTYATW